MSPMSEPLSFGVTTTFEGQTAVIVLQGRVEHLAAFELGASLDATIDRHPEAVVLDLSELAFMGAAGIVAVANAEKRLHELGGTLTIRSPSSLIRRLLGIMELEEMARLERRIPGYGHHDMEPAAKAPALRQPAEVKRPPEDVRRVIAPPADADVVDGALRLVVELARALVKGADGVSVSLLRHGLLSTVAASDQTIMDMDADQYATGEGPCIDASREGHPFHAPSLFDESRWPAFTPQALSLGIRSIISSPLKAFNQPVGALNIYSRKASAFNAENQAAAAVFAKKASIILSDAGVGATDAQVAHRYHQALKGREVITLAKGIIMEREGLGEDEAFGSLLRLSLSDGISLRARAEKLLQSISKPELGRNSDD
jgi:anti-anti-sigma factor